MPVDLADLRAKLRRKVPLTLNGEELLTLSWQVDKLNADLLNVSRRAIVEVAKIDESDDEAIAAAVPDIVRNLVDSVLMPLEIGWDVTKGGKPWPATTDNIASLGLLIVRAMTDAIWSDITKSMDFSVPKENSSDG